MNRDNNVMVQILLHAMQQVIQKYGLELMQHYPNDLLVHDKGMLERLATPGAKIGWMVGHLHTHLVALGLHQDENRNVEYLINLGSDDRFFVIDIRHGEKFSMVEVDRKAFAGLSNTAVPYLLKGEVTDFWLYNRKVKVGHVALKHVGIKNEMKVAITITPVAGISGLDRAALELWSSQSAVKMAQSLFVRSEVAWLEALQIDQAA